MLNFFFLNNSFFRLVQSGFYIDYYLKNIAEYIVRYIFIYMAQFFGEKYLIEILTKFLLNNIIFYFNNLHDQNQLFFITFFVQFLNFFFISLGLLNIFFFIMI